MEGVELVVGCVVRLVLWCANRREYFLCCFNLMLVEINGLSVVGSLLNDNLGGFSPFGTWIFWEDDR